MKVAADKYSVEFDKEAKKVTFKGTLRLQDKEQYREIHDLLLSSANETSDNSLELDMCQLKFLNSSGISSLSLFMIQMRKQGKKIHIMGSESIPWQVKSLRNFQKLYEQVKITFC